MFRSVVVACAAVSTACAGDLDKFVALIGSFACGSPVYTYPAFLHYNGVATSRIGKIGEVVIMMLDLCCMVFSTVITLKIWVQGGMSVIPSRAYQRFLTAGAAKCSTITELNHLIVTVFLKASTASARHRVARLLD